MFQKDLIGPLKQGVKCTTIRVWKTSKYKQLQAAVMKGGLVEAKANYEVMSVIGYLLIFECNEVVKDKLQWSDLEQEGLSDLDKPIDSVTAFKERSVLFLFLFVCLVVSL